MNESIKYNLTKIQPEAPRSWDVLVNGEKINGVESVSLINDALNMSVDYGMRPEGYDGFVIRELGGAVTLPWTIDEAGQIYVGLVDEYRPTMGEEHSLNAPRGMANKGENHGETARRELQEETGKDIGSRAVEMANNLNANSSLFDNSREENKGVSIYSVQLSSDELELGHSDTGELFYQFPHDVRNGAENSVVEKIYGTRFVHLNEAFNSKDMFTVTAVGLLVRELLQNGNYIVPQRSMAENPTKVRL
jgi:8-oxo-dGTP pyrophosphatase MutT (NUDIX family)